MVQVQRFQDTRDMFQALNQRMFLDRHMGLPPRLRLQVYSLKDLISQIRRGMDPFHKRHTLTKRFKKFLEDKIQVQVHHQQNQQWDYPSRKHSNRLTGQEEWTLILNRKSQCSLIKFSKRS